MIDVNLHISNYVAWISEAFGQFEKTGNVRILKDINEKVFDIKVYLELSIECKVIQQALQLEVGQHFTHNNPLPE